MAEGPSDTDFQRISEVNYNKLSASLTKAGYKDGISDGREAVFQHGFDIGYADGLKTGLQIAKWKTIRTTMQKQEKNFPNINEKHQILDADEKEHHKLLQNPTKTVDQISEFQREYVEKIKSALNSDFKEIKQFLE